MRLPVALSVVVSSLLSGWPIATTAEQHVGFPGGERESRVRGMTMNVYLGADLGKIIQNVQDRTSACRNAHDGMAAIPCAVKEVWDDFLSTDFPSRAKVLADHIKNAAPDVLGLQEVATTKKDGVVEQNFMEILQNELKNRSLAYEIAGECEVIKAQDSAQQAYNDAYNASSGTFEARFESKTALLVNTNTSAWENSTELIFKARISGTPPVTYCAVMADVKIREDESPYQVVSAHLTPSDVSPPDIQDKQAKELVEYLSNSTHPKIILADINSDPAHEGDETPYKVLTGAGYEDLWLDNRNSDASKEGLTYGHNASLTNEMADFTLRLDYVLYKDEGIAGKKKMAWMDTFGDDPADSKTADGKLWGSDHAAVFADMVTYEEPPSTSAPTPGPTSAPTPTQEGTMTNSPTLTPSGQGGVVWSAVFRFVATVVCVEMGLSML